ncbi:hypothetical protein E6C50_15940 [Flavobacterium supellecticarium]|uniref:Uncharacterized protein n=1 Tax=Flavobacterium supellecticarium TaxID=2565924 RepID=A0A4V3W7M5_9FLAO|nr:hypothetical protein [Flavobacterium supellecticarium]THF47923.1 hypothetical protein E6C50_15940 [Flavobacterium supellecticarium]
MSRFDLNAEEVYEILQKKGIKKLYHANTVATSRLYLEKEYLLSRQYVEDNKLYQTSQYTDDKDKLLGIYDDIFLDMVDIHDYLRKPNFYGPFLFVFSSEILRSNLFSTVRITKKNPASWSLSENEDNWYYSEIKDFEIDYMSGNKVLDVGKMIIIKKTNSKLSLIPHCVEFILDNPNIVVVDHEGKESYIVDVVKKYFYEVFPVNKYDHIIKSIRHKNVLLKCSCWRKYNYKFKTDINDFRRLFHKTP